MSLRAELIDAAGGMPAFAVLLPAGWEATDASFSTMRPKLDATLDQLPADRRAGLRSRMMRKAKSTWAKAAPAVVKRVEFTIMRDSSSVTFG